MGFMQWITGLLGQAQQAALPDSVRAAVMGPPDQPDEIEGLNFRKAVAAHQVWKKRIGDYINGKTKERLNPAEFSQEDQCVLGVWMTRYGNQRFGEEKLYQNLRLAHRQLHFQASRIITEYHKGNREHAQEMLSQGEYPLLGMRLAGLLARLYQRCQDGVI